MNLKVKTALVSVSDKENIISLLKILEKFLNLQFQGFELF